MKISKLTLLSLLLLLVISACKRPANTSDTFKPLDINSMDVEYLTLRSKVKYSDPGMGITTNTSLRMKTDSIIWISISTFGLEAARAYITPDTMILMNKLQREVMTYNFERLSRQLNFPVSFDLIQSALLGNLPRAMTAEDGVISRDGRYMISQDWGPVVVDNFVDGSTMKLDRIEAKEEATNNRLTVAYSEFNPVASFLFAHNGVISLEYLVNGEPAATTIDITHNRVDIPTGPLTFPFNVPAGYTIR